MEPAYGKEMKRRESHLGYPGCRMMLTQDSCVPGGISATSYSGESAKSPWIHREQWGLAFSHATSCMLSRSRGLAGDQKCLGTICDDGSAVADAIPKS